MNEKCMRRVERPHRKGGRIFLLTVLFALLLTCGAYAKTAKYYTPQQAASWIRTLAGQTVNYWNKPSNAQCTELVYCYYRHLDANAPDTDAWQYSVVKAPSGWVKIPYYAGFTAQPGDVAVWKGGRYGHVALIVSADRNSFLSLEQNTNGIHKAAFYRHSYGRSGELTFWGVIRPNFKGGRKDGHATRSGRTVRSCVYYYRGGNKTLLIKYVYVWYRGNRMGGSFRIYYKDRLLSRKNYKVRFSLNRKKKTMTCYLTGKGSYSKCRGKVTVPVS